MARIAYGYHLFSNIRMQCGSDATGVMFRVTEYFVRWPCTPAGQRKSTLWAMIRGYRSYIKASTSSLQASKPTFLSESSIGPEQVRIPCRNGCCKRHFRTYPVSDVAINLAILVFSCLICRLLVFNIRTTIKIAILILYA